MEVVIPQRPDITIEEILKKEWHTTTVEGRKALSCLGLVIQKENDNMGRAQLLKGNLKQEAASNLEELIDGKRRAELVEELRFKKAKTDQEVLDGVSHLAPLLTYGFDHFECKR
jgi:hypothetical protein